MNPTGGDRFVSDAGTEVSVRTSRDLSSQALVIEPLYATDIELLDGATGELHAQGKTLRGTLHRHGSAFVLASEQPPTRVTRSKTETEPSEVPVDATVATPGADPVPQPNSAATADAEALDAADTLSLFVRGEGGVPLKAVRRAHTVIGQFIAEQERLARARE